VVEVVEVLPVVVTDQLVVEQEVTELLMVFPQQPL
jgi:hypothetical protein